MGIAMLMASVIRKMPKMKPISRIAARDITEHSKNESIVFTDEQQYFVKTCRNEGQLRVDFSRSRKTEIDQRLSVAQNT
ncbi:hypothetical protein D3C76_1607920 [compost metagenome]